MGWSGESVGWDGVVRVCTGWDGVVRVWGVMEWWQCEGEEGRTAGRN